jgi:hypothetical protein
MAITYHSGERIQGTSSDRTTTFYRGETPIIDGSDTVIKFLQDGTFTPTSPFDVEYLVVGGGGGAGRDDYSGGRGSGGGGAGGFRTNISGATSGGGSSAESTYGVTAQNYTITVGTGGDGGTSSSVIGSDGVNSSIVPASGTSIISSGGGGGGGHNDSANYAGRNGGSGGGSANSSSASFAGDGVSGQGYDGGVPNDVSPYSGSGGGGAGSIGGSSSGGNAGSGGLGLQSSILNGSAIYYAGGGGAHGHSSQGAGGSSIGGAGSSGTGGSGTINTGSGGGASHGANGGSGGSGIIIIRFLTSGNTYDISTSDMPSDVPDYSRFEETDTRKMYSYLSTLKVDEDFSTDNSYDTQTGTAYTVDYTTDDRIEFDFTKDGSTHEVSFDLESMGGFTMDSSSWVAEWTFKVLDSFAQASTSGAHATMAISSVADGGNNQTGDHVALEIRNVVSAGSLMNLVGGVNTGMDNARTTGSVDVGTNGFERFIRLIKNGNTCTLEIYTDSNRNTTPTTHTITLAHTVAMKYFRVLNFTGASGGSNAAGNMSVDNFKFYNGVTDASITALWKELGT